MKEVKLPQCTLQLENTTGGLEGHIALQQFHEQNTGVWHEDLSAC